MQSQMQDNKFKLVFSKIFEDFSFTIVGIDCLGFTAGRIGTSFGTVKTYVPSSQVDFNTFSVTFLVDNFLDNYETLDEWGQYIADPRCKRMNEYFETATLQMYSPDGEHLRKEIIFSNVFPTALSSIVLNTNATKDQYEATVTFSFDEYRYPKIKGRERKYFVEKDNDGNFVY